MKNRARTQVLSVCGLGAASLLVVGCEQPKPKCNIARGDFAAHYTLVSGEGDCATLTGEVLSVQGYNQPISSKDKSPDYNRTSIGIQPSGITNYLYSLGVPNPEDKPYALGGFEDSTAGSDDFCVVPTLNVARVRMDAYPEMPNEDMCMPPYPAQDAVDVQYQFSNVRVYNTAADTGTSFAADLTYIANGCTAVYKVTAVYPVVSCALELPVDADAAAPAPTDGEQPDAAQPDDAGIADGGDLDGSVAVDADGGEPAPEVDCGTPEPEAPVGEMVPDDTLCDSVPDISKGRTIGSGISPDYATVCSPDTMFCVLKSDPPSLK
ncbi:MAG: hypothetical protein QM778_02030 [Myxococcales bacterium]